METIFVQGLIFPTIVLLIEYLIIQPWLRIRELNLLTSGNIDTGDNGRKWSDGLRLSVKHFKQNFSNYSWGGGLLRYHLVEVSDFSIGRGQAELNLIVKVRYLLDTPRPVAVYKLVIDRIGDILQIETVSEIDPFEDRDLKVPESWLAIGAISLAIFMCTNSETVGSQQSRGIVNSTPVVNLWSQANPILINSSINGTVGGEQIVAYIYKSETNDTIIITVDPIGEFVPEILVYNQSNALVQSRYINPQYNNVQFAAVLNESYLILIIGSRREGGSYKLKFDKLLTPP